VAFRACTVSFRGVSGVRHSVDLDAESVYEAAVRGIALLKKDGWVDNLGPGTEGNLRFRFGEPATTHQVSHWSNEVAARISSKK
jgi:hypothetical protein